MATQLDIFKTRLKTNRYATKSGALRSIKMMHIKGKDAQEAEQLAVGWFSEKKPDIIPHNIPQSMGKAIVGIMTDKRAQTLIREFFDACKADGINGVVAMRILDAASQREGE